MAHSTSDFVTALCNQPEAFASDLCDDESHYLLAQLAGLILTRANLFVLVLVFFLYFLLVVVSC